MKKRFISNPAFIIIAVFIAAYALVPKYLQQRLSDEPVQLTRADPPEIVMYSTRGCLYCKIARAFFEKHKLPYTEYDIENSDKHMQTFMMLGGKGTPLIIVNRDIIYGYDEQLIRDSL